jgi:hypothetical protein
VIPIGGVLLGLIALRRLFRPNVHQPDTLQKED